MKKCIIIITLIILLTGCYQSNDSSINDKEGNNTMSSEQVLSVNQFIELTSIDREKYKGIDLQQFIEEYDIKKSNINTLNIEYLLENYKPSNQEGNTGDYFDFSRSRRTENYLQDISEIAFFENKGTDIKCVYVDVLNHKRYKLFNGYLFDDINQVQPEIIDSELLITGLDELGLFKWQIKPNKMEITDSQTMKLCVTYLDGSIFCIEANGVLADILPDEYSMLKELLFE